MGTPWTPSEERTLRAQYPTMTAVALGEELGRSPLAIHARAFKLGIATKRLTEEQEERVVLLYDVEGKLMREVSEEMGVSYAQIRRILREHQIPTDRSRAAKAAGRPTRRFTRGEKEWARLARSHGLSLLAIRTRLACSKESFAREFRDIVEDGRLRELIGARLRRPPTTKERAQALRLIQKLSVQEVHARLGLAKLTLRGIYREAGIDTRATVGPKLSRIIRAQYRSGQRHRRSHGGRGIPTHGLTPFQGRVRFRSRTEARRAQELDAEGRAWLFEAKRYLLSDGRCYTPDFWIFRMSSEDLKRVLAGRHWHDALEELLALEQDVKPWWSPTHPSYEKIQYFAKKDCQNPFRILVMPDVNVEGKYGRHRREVWLWR